MCLNETQLKFYKTNADSRVQKSQKEGFAQSVINNTQGHEGQAEKAYLSTSLFTKGQYIKDLNNDKKIDKDEMISWLLTQDKIDNQDGIINPENIKNDYLDILGFKSNKTSKINKEAKLINTINQLNELLDYSSNWAGRVAIKAAENKIITGLTTIKEGENIRPIDFIMQNKESKEIMEKIQKENPEFVEKLFNKAYNKEIH